MQLTHFTAALSAVSLLSFAAAACSERAEPDAAQGDATTTPAPPIESTALPDDAIATPAAQSAPFAAADRGEQGAKSVLSAWANALEDRDFSRAHALWAEGAVSVESYAAQFAEYRKIVVSFGDGRVEGAAGSLYYEAPVNFTGILANGTPVRRSGTIVLRRVNDVPGASPEQLRWRIYRTSLQV